MNVNYSMMMMGPLFDGTAARAMREGAIAVRHKLADEGRQKVHTAFNSMIHVNKHVFTSTMTEIDTTHVYVWGGDAGKKHYTMPVVVDDPATETVVTTELSTYGPWLEGTGSRNQTTRFKGYHGFRIAAQELEAESSAIADEALAPYVMRCN